MGRRHQEIMRGVLMGLAMLVVVAPLLAAYRSCDLPARWLTDSQLEEHFYAAQEDLQIADSYSRDPDAPAVSFETVAKLHARYKSLKEERDARQKPQGH